MLSNFKERFSLDDSVPEAPGTEPSGPQQLPLGMEPVLKAFGNQILTNIKSAPNRSSDLLGLARMSSVRIENILPVVQYLVGQGQLTRVVEDPTGNDTYQATSAGEAARA